MSEAHNKAQSKYRKNLKRMTIEFYPTDQDILDKLDSVESKQGYIKNLIREDIKKEDTR